MGTYLRYCNSVPARPRAARGPPSSLSVGSCPGPNRLPGEGSHLSDCDGDGRSRATQSREATPSTLSSHTVLLGSQLFEFLSGSDLNSYWASWKRVRDEHEFGSLRLTSFFKNNRSRLWLDDVAHCPVSVHSPVSTPLKKTVRHGVHPLKKTVLRTHAAYPPTEKQCTNIIFPWVHLP